MPQSESRVFTTAEVRAATGVSVDDIKNFVRRGQLISAVEPPRQGHDRRWSFDAVAEIAVMAAFVRSGLAPAEGLAINAQHLPMLRKVAASQKGSGWVALVRLDPEHWEATALNQISDPRLEAVASSAGSGWAGDDESSQPATFNVVLLLPVRLIFESLKSDLARLSGSDNDD